MNEETIMDEELKGVTIINMPPEDETDTAVETEKSSEGNNGLATLIGGLAVFGAVSLGAVAVTGVKKGISWVKNKRARKKVEPDEDGCVAESDAEEVAEEPKETQEENVQKNRKK